MPRWLPCKRDDFIAALKRLDFEGPFQGTKHAFMLYGNHAQTIPSTNEYSVDKLRELIRQVELVIGREITLVEWDKLRRGKS